MTNSNKVVCWAEKKFGVEWAHGFWRGIDGVIDERDLDEFKPEKKRGYLMGEKVRVALNLY